MSEQQQCAVCQALVPVEQVQAHLANNHSIPANGVLFYYEARPYRTDKPSMQVSELLQLVGGSREHAFYEYRDGAMIPLSFGEAVDLTNGLHHFYSIPAARI